LNTLKFLQQKIEKRRLAARRAISEHPTDTVTSSFLLPSFRTIHGLDGIIAIVIQR
jgi:hypothetical protein